jgi:hypothetical protein
MEAGSWRKMARKIGIWTIVIVVGGGLIYYGISAITYSEGARSGVLIKISKKGYLFKTYEGELALSGVGGYIVQPGSQGNVWNFSVKNKETYQKMQEFEGRSVSLKYKQKLRTFFWQGETEYLVYDVEQVPDAPAIPR